MGKLEEELAPYRDLDGLTVTPIEDGDAYTKAGAGLREVKAIQREVDTIRKVALAPHQDEVRRINGLIDPIKASLVSYETAIKQAMKSYTDRVEAERRRVEGMLRDQQRQAEEAARKAAEILRQDGKNDEAEAIEESVPSVPIVVADIPKVSGVYGRKTWKSEVVDFPVFLQWVIDNGMFNLIDIKDAELNAIARQQRTGGNVPGVRFYEEETVVARS